MNKLLEKINSPADLKGLSLEDMALLSREIREVIIEVVARNGGHLSSNLGAVDLSIALHRVFDSPRDKLVWDIGHQCYTHKILTGRRDRIAGIRTRGGLMGYPDIRESEHDVCNVGHASTSLGIASGLCIARDRLKEDYHVVTVIGDGALTGGVALEALNHIGQVKQRMIIVLNDNKMSISPNVGGNSKHLNYLVAGRPYIRLKEVIQGLLKSIPGIGKSMFEVARKVEILMRTMMVPGSLFDELGVKYIGPINGHDLGAMIKEFEEAKNYDFPLLLHVVTRKGEGYSYAADDPSAFHSSAPFNVRDGKFVKKEKHPSYSEVFGRAVRDLVALDPRIVAITAAMPEGTGLDLVQKEFPDNFFDVGIAEQYMFDFACGLARGGLKPIIGVYSTFLQRSLDQVIHDVSLMNIPLVVGIDRAGLVGGDGPTHQGIFDIALLRPVPDIVMAAPADEGDLRDMLYSALQWEKPVFIRYPKEPGQGRFNGGFRFVPLGRSVLSRQGDNGWLLAVGPMLWRALEAAEKLQSEHGLNLNVVDVRFLKPLDRELFDRVLATGLPVITVEDSIVCGGFASIFNDFCAGSGIRPPVLNLGVSAEGAGLASREELLSQFDLDARGIASRTLAFIGELS